jgi:hypothetical protein
MARDTLLPRAYTTARHCTGNTKSSGHPQLAQEMSRAAQDEALWVVI